MLQGLPSALVLENEDNELALLVPAVLPVRPLIRSEPFSTEIMFDRTNRAWLNNCEVRHYLYPVHLSRGFLFTPTFASTLYLLLLRMMHRRYDEVFRMFELCTTDAKLTAEEQQIFDQFEQVTRDYHPDAHACRLRMQLMTAETPLANLVDSSRELENYIRKEHLVSAECRLSLQEQISLIEACPRMSPTLANRLVFLRKLPQTGELHLAAPVVPGRARPSPPLLTITLPPIPVLENEFYRVDDQSLLAPDTKESLADKIFGVSYTRPDVEKKDYNGANMVAFLNKALKDPIRIRGGSQVRISRTKATIFYFSLFIF